MKRLLPAFIAVLALFGCSEYNKVLKSNDPEYKFQKALEYYNNGECFKALPIFDELVPILRGTQRSEEAYYYLAYSHYCTREYYLANFYFKSFVKNFPASKFAEESLFMTAMCSYKISPEHSLDQTQTKLAIDEFQLFMNRYPQSSLRDSCNNMIGTLRLKLETKAFEIAKQYLKTEKYKAAHLAFENLLRDYPETRFREEAMFLQVKSDYLYAANSTPAKMRERHEATVKSYLTFVASYPKSKWLRDAENFYAKSYDYLSSTKSK
jgi:outer membrane protein assembly factor BamD